MKINVTTNIRTNTQKLASVDEMPPDIRAAYEQALANGPGTLTTTEPKIVTRLVVNGHEVETPKAMSDAEQKLVSGVMELLKNSGASVDGAATAKQSPALAAPSPTPVETGWLTKTQRKLILAAIVVIGIVLAFALARLHG